MVSTRGVKLKFFENEKVLCYEPDPTKAKVLYDSKVLDVVINKDQKGKKSVEYLIHFQGWNSSWDRCVSEEYVLKDTPENRQLQKDLAEKAQLQIGAYLYRRERKKHSRKTSEPTIAASSEDGSSGSPVRMDTDDGGQEASCSSEDDSSADEGIIPIELTQDLRTYLEQDYCLIKTNNKLLKLPAEPNVITILEMYWKQYANNQLDSLKEKRHTRGRIPYINNKVKRQPEVVERNLRICKEMLDGIRVYFDFVLNNILLYNSEKGQVQTSPAVYPNQTGIVKEEILNKYENENFPTNSNNNDESNSSNGPKTRRQLRSNNKPNEVHSNGNSNPHETISNNNRPSSSNNTAQNNSDVNNLISKTLSWKLLPDFVYEQQPLPPCLVYGAIHLARLFVRLPELLNSTNMDDLKLKTLIKNMDPFIDFLSDHKEWYGEKFYIDNP